MSNLINITNNKIYKLNYLVDGNLNIIFVFYGKKVVSNVNNELFKEIFTDEENIKFSDGMLS